MRGYFAIGVERLSKPVNAGNLFRSAHAFGASFVFTIAANYSRRLSRSDTSAAFDSLPVHDYATAGALDLPRGCALVGVELLDEAVRANIRASVDHLRHGSEILETLIRDDGLLIVGAEYSLKTGAVDFFDD